MYQTSSDYKELVYADNTRHLLKIYIDGNEVNPNHILDFRVCHTLFSNDEFCLGSVTAKIIEFRIYKGSLPEIYQNFYVESGVGDEIVPIGYFRLDSIGKEDDDTITITAIDDMVKFEFNYDGSELTFPATMLEVLQDMCLKAGVECGSMSFLNDDKTIAVYDNTVSAREYLSYIAEQAGGFACIGRDGRLYIRKIGESVVDCDIKYFQRFTWGEGFKVSRVVYEDGVQDFEFGDETNNTIWMNQDNMYIVNSEQVENIYNAYVDFECNSFEGTSIIDPACDVGDILMIDGKKVIYQGSMDYVGKFKADISSKVQAKMKEETTITRVSDKVRIRRVQSSIDQVKGEIETLVQEVDESSEKMTQVLQSVDEITQRVENVAELTKTVNGIKTITIENAVLGAPIEIRILGNNTVFGGLYFDDCWCFDENYYFTNGDAAILINDDVYDLEVDEVLRQYEGVYDEYIFNYTENTAKVIRRIGVDGVGGLFVLPNEIVENVSVPNFELKDGENVITILNYSANMLITYVQKNDYTNMFATKIEMNTAISIKADEIDQIVKQKIGNDEIIASINMAIRNGQGIITISGNQVIIESDKFGLTKDGVITATAGKIAGLLMSTNASGNSFLYKNYVAGGKTYQSGLYIPNSGTGSEVFMYAGVDVTSGSLSDSNFYVRHNGDAYARSFNIISNGALYFWYGNGKVQASYSSNYITRYNENGNRWIVEGRGFVSGVATAHVIWIHDAQYYQIQDGIHNKVIVNFKRINDSASSNLDAEFYSDIHVWGNRQTDGINNSIYIRGYEVATNASDKRLKENIEDSTMNALEIIKCLSVRQFDWRKDIHTKEAGSHVDIGYVAQEVEQIFSQLVNYNEENDTYQMNVLNLSSLHTKAIQELSDKDDEQDKKITDLEKENERLKITLEELMKRIEKLEGEEKENG